MGRLGWIMSQGPRTKGAFTIRSVAVKGTPGQLGNVVVALTTNSGGIIYHQKQWLRGSVRSEKKSRGKKKKDPNLKGYKVTILEGSLLPPRFFLPSL